MMGQVSCLLHEFSLLAAEVTMMGQVSCLLHVSSHFWQ
eukprot:CAMPEP_0182816480 /NCGR_PEP_ID=MMETSP0006_2-20121128/10959_1 /TAXON_ID=97485 /ORGANISM="Prymnesium parvum, Strain Texoma1" /LENGTH=37 /DNA_ID= /DNA_START= /DNA_END= /DNA_ORIENTATION=